MVQVCETSRGLFHDTEPERQFTRNRRSDRVLAVTMFGQRIKALLKQRGLTLRAFGAMVQMSHGNISKVLNGSHEAPNPPVGVDLEMWFDAIGTVEAEEPQLRLLAAAAHCRDPQARSELEAFIVCHAGIANCRAAEGSIDYKGEDANDDG